MTAHGGHVRDQFALVVGGLADPGADDQARGGLHAGLGVVGLLKAVLGFHNPAVGVGEVDLVGGLRGRIGGLRRTTSWRFACGRGRGAAGELGLVLGLLGLEAGVGAPLHLGLGALELRLALVAALHFGGNA